MCMQKIFLALSICVFSVGFSQEEIGETFIDVNYIKGNIALHNPNIIHLIQGHPEGVILAWNKKTFGKKAWQQHYNYPDYGVSFAYQDFKNPVLGDVYGLYTHFNFYFLKRHLMLRIGQGLALTSNPYHKDTNFKNIAFGSKILSSTLLMLNYKKERLFKNVGVQAGLTLAHYSNANVKAPNTSVNTLAINLGLNYSLDTTTAAYITDIEEKKVTEPIKFNLVFRSGINENDVIGSGQFPFYVVSAYADKRLTYKSAIQFGADVFFSNSLKEFIYFKSIAFPNQGVTGDEDYKRAGIFVGHELFINKLSVVSQAGYYVYYPFDFEGRTYFRIGLKHYFSKKVFAALTVKSHAAKAEAVELGVGIRL